MIRNRFWLLPLWVQGLVRAAIFAIAVGGVVSVLYPMFVYRMGWPLTALSVIALCGTAIGAALYIQRPVRQRAYQALGGLDRPGSLAALEALRTGEVPADPDVLAAAIRAGALVQAYRHKTTRTQRAAQRLIPAVAITAGVVELFRLPVAFGGLLIGVGLLWVLQLVTTARRRRRTDKNLHVLRAATDPGLGQAEEVDASTLPPIRSGRVTLAIAILVTAFMALVWFVAYSEPQCNTVNAVMQLVYDKRQLGDPQNMTRGQPDVATYRGWSDQLHRYADQVSDPRIAPGLHRIADLSDQAVTQFAQSRDALVSPPHDYSLADQEKTFSTTMQALFDEENAVGAICFPRR
jgi:hypothetical protein